MEEVQGKTTIVECSFSDLPKLALELVVQMLDPHSRGVTRHVSPSLRLAVREVEIDGEAALLDVANLIDDIEARRNRAMVGWLLKQGCPSLSRSVTATLAGAGWLEELKDAKAGGCQVEICSWVAAARAGRVDVLDWLLMEQGAEVLRNSGLTVCGAAAEGGQLEALQWAYARGADMSYSTTSKAAAGGHANLLKWAVDNYCSWDNQVCVEAANCGHWGLFLLAAKEGGWTLNGNVRHFILRAVYRYMAALPVSPGTQVAMMATDPDNCPDVPDMEVSVLGDSILAFWKAVAYLKREHGFKFTVRGVLAVIARKGDLDFLQAILVRPLQRWFAVEDGEKYYLSMAAAEGGHIHILEWLHSQGANLDPAAASAVRSGHTAVLLWMTVATAKIIRFDDIECFEVAAGDGHVSVLQWAHEAGYLPDLEPILSQAVSAGQLSVVQWVFELDPSIPIDFEQDLEGRKYLPLLTWAATTFLDPHEIILQPLLKLAIQHSLVDVLEWLLSSEDLNHRPSLTETASCAAAATGHLGVLQLLRAHGCPWSSMTTYCAARHGHLPLLRWAVSQGCEYDGRELRAAAKAAGFHDLLRWMNTQMPL